MKHLAILAILGTFSGVSITSASATASELTLHWDSGVPGQSVSVATDFMEWKAWPLSEDPRSRGHYAISFEAPWRHEVAYKFVVNGLWVRDPANPDVIDDGHGGFNSKLAIPEFVEDPWLQPSAPALEPTTLILRDFEGDSRPVTVLSADPALESVTVYFQDGGDYLAQASAGALLANLSAAPGWPRVTGVFIPPKDRMREYELLPAYADWVAEGLVAAVEARWPHTGGASSRRLLVGSSLGGLITLYTALRHPDVFGNAASQSGSLWFGEGALIPMLSAPASSTAQRLYLDCGTYEDEDMTRYNRQGSDAAFHAGRQSIYREYPSTHDWMLWRNRLRSLVDSIFGP